jgi:DNA-binding transcriptional MerR regulator
MQNEDSPADGCSEGYAKLGLYPIRVAARVTGINVHTLRAWERRYGLPRPTRSAGTHRLYDADDIAMLRRVQELTTQGTPPGRACAYVLAEAAEGASAGEGDSSQTLEDQAGTMRDHLVRSFTELNEESAARMLREATQVLGPEMALTGVLLPALSEIGSAWEEGRASVATEHFGTGIIRSWILAQCEGSGLAEARPTALLGAGPNEQHELPPLSLAMLLRRRGWHAVFLGTGMPFEALSDAIARKRPQLVCLSCTTGPSVPGLVDALQQIRCLPEAGQTLLAYGGLPFTLEPALRAPLEGIATYLGDNLRGAADLASSLLQRQAAGATAFGLD